MYTTIAHIRQMTPFKDETLISGTHIEEKIGEADSIIDSAITETYILPLSETPKIIENISKSLTSCLLYREQATNIEGQGVDITSWINEQMTLLDNIRLRKLKLIDSNGNELALRKNKKIAYYPNSETERTADTDQKF